jgi:hypothetical protein
MRKGPKTASLKNGRQTIVVAKECSGNKNFKKRITASLKMEVKL